MPIRLKAVRFQKKDIDQVQGFQCGPLPYQVPLADWIKKYSLTALERRTKIWLYKTDNEREELVGYGSLGKAGLLLAGEDGKGEEEVKVVSIPALAIHEQHWHKPDDASERDDRFSYQLVRHLQQEALAIQKKSPVLQPLLMLYVHPENLPAKKLYANCGFKIFPEPPDPPHTFYDEVTGANCPCMILRLQ